jgi:two-component system chemotaxis response regulator CheB
MLREKIRVLIVDDSASVRQILTVILNEDPDIEVMASASDPFAAARRLQEELPDVIILDIEMPRMDGITFLRKIMAQRPIPVIICSTLTEQGSDLMFEAFEAGAVDIVSKPRVDTRQALMESSTRLRDAVKSAARARVRPRSERRPVIEAKLTADAIIPPPVQGRSRPATERIVCIGVSTGGTEALRDVLEVLPADCPGILIVQHMPQGFPVLPFLQEALDAVPKGTALTFLTNNYGKPFASAAAFGNKFADWCDDAKLPTVMCPDSTVYPADCTISNEQRGSCLD